MLTDWRVHSKDFYLTLGRTLSGPLQHSWRLRVRIGHELHDFKKTITWRPHKVNVNRHRCEK